MTHAAYLFPGQGSQTVGMGRLLVESFAVARRTFEQADAILGFSLSDLCFTGPEETLTATINAQPALLVTAVAALRALRDQRPELPAPLCVAGHSLGEYAALVAAGALPFEDAVRLTRLRGELMGRAGAAQPGSMAAVLRLSDEQVADICRQAMDESGAAVQVANYNSPGQVVISGSALGVAAATTLAKAAGARVMPLAVSIAAHSALMQPVQEEFAQAVAAVAFAAPELPIYGNVTAAPLDGPAAIRAELSAQLTSPVRWTATIQAMTQAGVERFVEIGPGAVLTGLVKRIAPAVATANVSEPAHLTLL